MTTGSAVGAMARRLVPHRVGSRPQRGTRKPENRGRADGDPNYLTQRFTQLVGQHMHGYIIAFRVDRACRELLGTDLPIKRIALEPGFREGAAVSSVFRRQLGVSPSEYRRIFTRR
jgi:AraC-like DNA-binding protein